MATLEIDDSACDMTKLISSLTIKHSGKFIDTQGDVEKW
jgi:hypothetical protein